MFAAFRFVRCAVAVVVGIALVAMPGSAVAGDRIPTLVEIRAAHHPAANGRAAFDRLVFEFTGPLPEHYGMSWETEPRYGTASVEEVGLVPISGNAYLEVRFYEAWGHRGGDLSTSTSYGPRSRAFALPNIMQVVNNDDFEATMSFLVGVSQRAPVRLFTLTSPSRIVVDLDADLATVPVRTYFQDLPAYAAGRDPDLRAVTRQVLPPATARGALQRLFAGPTNAELAAGLRLVSSGAKGFSALSITNGVARVQLTGVCDSGGSTFTVAGLIIATLKQFPSISWVKIYDPSGNTQNPNGRSDSVPECLEP
jgi:hypothetical protein